MHTHAAKQGLWRRSWPARLVIVLGVGVLLFAGGCGRPDRANIALRMQIQELEAQMADLQRQREGHLATIRSLQAQQPTVATLPQDRLETLFTTHGLRIGRLTGGVNLDPTLPGDEGLQIHVVPVDQRGDLLKAAGSFVIDAYDLAVPENPHLGRWEITPEDAARDWFGSMLSYGYRFLLPWQRTPQSDQLTIRVTFTDALTGRQFSEQQQVTITPPGAREPAPPTAAGSGGSD